MTAPDTKSTVAEILEQAGFSTRPATNSIIVVQDMFQPEIRSLPEFTIAECRYSLQHCKRLLAPFRSSSPNGARGSTALARQLVDSFTPEQIATMGDRISVDALSPTQQRTLWNLALHVYVDSAEADIDTTLELLKALEEKETKIRFRSGDDIAVGVNSSSLGIFAPRFRGRWLSPFVPFALRSNKPAPSPEPDTEEIKDETTLGALAAQWNRSQAQLQIEVDPSLADKPVTLIDGRNGDGDSLTEHRDPQDIEALARAIAQACSLRVIAKEGHLTLAPRRIFTPFRLADLPRGIRSALPDALIRFVEITDTASSAAGKNNPADIIAVMTSRRSMIYIPDDMNASLVARLTGTVAPRLLQRPDSALPALELTGQEKRLAATALLARTLLNLKRVWDEKQPAYISDFAHASLKGGATRRRISNEPIFSFSVETPEPDGRFAFWFVFSLPQQKPVPAENTGRRSRPPRFPDKS